MLQERRIEVGGQRLVATSSIRSAGPQILVNQKPIPVNPVVIKAVGDPQVLESSLDLIKKTPSSDGGSEWKWSGMTTLAYRRTAPNDQPVKWRKVRRPRVVRMGELDWLALLLLASIVLLFDALVIGRYVGLIRLPGELTALDMARLGAMGYVDMQRTMLERDEFAGGIGSAEPVLTAAAQNLIAARNVEDIGRELAQAAADLHEAVQSDRLSSARGRVLELLSSDSGGSRLHREGCVHPDNPPPSESQVQDRQNVLGAATREALSADPLIARSPTAIEVVIDQSGISFDTGDLATQADLLAREIDSIHEEMDALREAAGLSELEGEGVIVLAYDAPSGYGFDEIVHQRDVSEILDRLFAAGARGAQVGGRANNLYLFNKMHRSDSSGKPAAGCS